MLDRVLNTPRKNYIPDIYIDLILLIHPFMFLFLKLPGALNSKQSPFSCASVQTKINFFWTAYWEQRGNKISIYLKQQWTGCSKQTVAKISANLPVSFLRWNLFQINRFNRSQVFYKKLLLDFSKNPHGNTLFWSLLFNTVAGSSSATLWKRDPDTRVLS